MEECNNMMYQIPATSPAMMYCQMNPMMEMYHMMAQMSQNCMEMHEMMHHMHQMMMDMHQSRDHH